MKDIMNKDIRRKLIASYLNAETSSEEEKLLVRYFTCNKVDKDELAIAQLIIMEQCGTSLLLNEGVEQYNRIVSTTNTKYRQINIRWITWVGGLVATVALFFALRSFSTSQSSFNTVEIAQELQQMMNLEIEDIITVTAIPFDECILLNAELQDGTVKTFIMSKEEEMNTTSLLAIN